jgi:hypothetical protein
MLTYLIWWLYFLKKFLLKYSMCMILNSVSLIDGKNVCFNMEPWNQIEGLIFYVRYRYTCRTLVFGLVL